MSDKDKLKRDLSTANFQLERFQALVNSLNSELTEARTYSSALESELKARAVVSPRTIRVSKGETPLNEKLGHWVLNVLREGERARDAGTGSPYSGHSLEHCLHAAGWVSRDLRLALDAAKKAEESKP